MDEQSGMPLAHPSLYALDSEGTLKLHAGQCVHCGRVGFPRQEYGCEACGAHGTALVDVDLAATGELISFAEVRRHNGADINTPFVMAEVRLDAGPLLRGTLSSRHAAGLQVGERLYGTLVAGDRPGSPLELRFASVEA